MKKNLPGLYQNFIHQLQEVESNEPETIDRFTTCIQLCEAAIQQLREIVRENGFTGSEQEIHFFKVTKPSFTLWWVFYTELYYIHRRWPLGNETAQKEYLSRVSEKITRYCQEHQPFYEYYRAGHTHLDHGYFVREGCDWCTSTDSQLYLRDLSFSTPQDNVLTTLLAYEKLQEYIQYKQCLLLGGMKAIKAIALEWKGSKIELVELIYALVDCGRINSGTITVKQLARFFEEHWNIPMNDTYSLYKELRMRKSGPTVFLEFLCDVLRKRVDKDDKLGGF